MTLQKILVLLTTVGAVTAMTSDLTWCSGTGPDLNKPEEVWDSCMQETIKWEVWHDKQQPELAALTAYRTCRPDFTSLMNSLPTDAGRKEYRVKVKSENDSLIAFGREMLKLGDPALTVEVSEPQSIETAFPKPQPQLQPDKVLIPTVEAQAAAAQAASASQAIASVNNASNSNILTTEFVLPACRWLTDVDKWINLNNAGRSDLAGKLDCIVLPIGTQMIEINSIESFIQVELTKSNSGEQFWVPHTY